MAARSARDARSPGTSLGRGRSVVSSDRVVVVVAVAVCPAVNGHPDHQPLSALSPIAAGPPGASLADAGHSLTGAS